MLQYLVGALVLAAAIGAVTNPGPDGFAPAAIETLSKGAGPSALTGAVQGDCSAKPKECAQTLRGLFAVEESNYVVMRGVRLTAALLGAKTQVDCVGGFGGWACTLAEE